VVSSFVTPVNPPQAVPGGKRDAGTDGSSGRVELGESAAGGPVDAGEVPADEEAAASELDVEHGGIDQGGGRAGHRDAGRHIDPDELGAGLAVDHIELAAYVDRRAVRARGQGADVAVEGWVERGEDCTGRPVEREDIAARDNRAAFRCVAGLGERAAEHDRVAHHRDREDIAVEHMRRVVSGIGVDGQVVLQRLPGKGCRAREERRDRDHGHGNATDEPAHDV